MRPGAVGVTRGARLGANVIENVVDRHSFRESRCEGRYLSMDIGEPGRTGPPAQFHDEVAVDPIQFECHGAARSQRVGADSSRAVSAVKEATEDDTFTDGTGDVRGGNVTRVRHKADGEAGVGRSHGVQGMYPVGECLDRAERVSRGGVVHRAATLAVLLVVDIESSRVGLPEGSQRCMMWDDFPRLEETHVLSAELDCPSLGFGCWHCVLSRAQQEKEGDRYEIRHRCGPGGVFVVVILRDAPNSTGR